MTTHIISFQGLPLEYTLVRKNIKNINLRVNKKGDIVVSAPTKVPLAQIEEFVSSKANWILSRLAEIEQAISQAAESNFENGKDLYLLGNPYPLQRHLGNFDIQLTEEAIHLYTPTTDESVAKEFYMACLQKIATPVFQDALDRVYPLVKDMGVPYPEIKIRNMSTIWGSCSPHTGEIRLNLQLIKADTDCIDQVVLHELLHFLYPNHQAEFKAMRQKLMPDWKTRKNRLQDEYKDGIGVK
ncbi:SprT family zinc-dependent metalloprotease [Chakrabartyella piscis]|uniref:M48 family metallopeptidase n=1 Tax=Chakrabartyella piscis TaxID=2918914 RepID=UPI00295864B6|nr:SprT family zinc-dependent metalloprotease [Chakrabartyella piscis]